MRTRPSIVPLNHKYHIRNLTSHPGLILGLIVVIGAPLAINLPVSHDVVWQMWIARQIDHGAKLYVDILELNPPLWFWIGLLAQKAGTILHVSPLALLELGVWLWAAFSARVVGLLWPELTRGRQTALVVFTFAVCTLLPLHSYGQREHLVLIASLPYTFLLAARARGLHPNRWLAFAVSVAAAIGFALKHYFVLVPVAGEVWLLLQLGRKYRPLRLETIVLLALALLYGAAVLLWAKAFLLTMVPMIKLAYKGYETPFVEQVNKPEQIVWLLAALCLARFGRPQDPAARRLGEILTLSSAGFIVAYFAQQKGWQYHAVPATGTATIAVFVSWILPPLADRRTGQLVVPAATCLLPLLLGAIQGPYVNGNAEGYDFVTRGMTPRSSFLAITTNPSWSWPMVDTTRHVWPSRYFAFWMIPAIGVDASNGSADPAMSDLGKEVVRNTVEDMRCNPPERVLVEAIPVNPGLRAAHFQMLEFFDQDPGFAQVMRNYRQTAHFSGFNLYARTRPYGRIQGDHCRSIASDHLVGASALRHLEKIKVRTLFTKFRQTVSARGYPRLCPQQGLD